jgi:Xaa-Pro aminopeptidase
MKKGDLVLIDAGCEFQHYAADVTRTIPVSGSFSRSQQALYEVVLEANRQAIDMCRPGVTFIQPHDRALTVMVEGLVSLNLLQGDVGELIAEEAYQAFCPHRSSHWLGSDVHDVGDYRVDGAWRGLQPGMVLTIEPGIYIPDDETTAHLPPRWRGIGIRIEDDVVITNNGREVLTDTAPKAVDDVVRAMGRGARG